MMDEIRDIFGETMNMAWGMTIVLTVIFSLTAVIVTVIIVRHFYRKNKIDKPNPVRNVPPRAPGPTTGVRIDPFDLGDSPTDASPFSEGMQGSSAEFAAGATIAATLADNAERTGGELYGEKNAANEFCPFCGAPREEGRFCPFCGNKYEP